MRMTVRVRVWVWLILAVLTLASTRFASCLAQETPQKAIIVKAVVGGAGLLEKWAKALESANDGMSVVVIGSTEERAFEALLSQEASLALLLGKVTKEQQARAAEKGLDLMGTFVGRTGFAIITHRSNPVSALTVAQVRGLFTGVNKTWSKVGGPDEPVKIFIKRPAISPVTKLFRQDVLLWSAYASDAVVVNSFMSVIRRCIQAEGLAIGFVPFSLLSSTATGRQVKVIALKKTDTSDFVFPSDQTIEDLSYPAAGIPLYLYWDKKNEDPRIKKFADYCILQGGIREKR